MKYQIPLIVILCGQCYGENVELQTALSLIKAQTQSVRVAEWRCEMTVFELGDPGDPNSIVRALPKNIKSFVRVDPSGRRYLAEIDAVIPWKQGRTPFLGRTKAISYDGKVYRGWNRNSSEGKIPDETNNTRGAISDNADDVMRGDYFETWAYSLGTGFVFPYFYTFEEASAAPKTLYSFLALKEKLGALTLHITEEGIWEFATGLSKLDECPILIRYSPAKKVLVGAVWGTDDPSWQRWEADFAEIASGVWAPDAVTLVSTSPPRLVKFAFSEIKVNPPPFDGQFRVQFPTGTRVEDHIRKTFFEVGSGDPEMSADAVTEFAARNSLALSSRDGTSFTTWMLIANLVLIVGLLMVLLIKMKRKANT